MRNSIILLLVLSFSQFAWSQDATPAPRNPLYGGWSSVRIVGDVCSRELASISYYFGEDKSYKARSKMTRFNKEQTAEGTFETMNGTVTGYVEGHTVGPFKYRFDDDMLVIEQIVPPCNIYLQRDDF